MPSFATCSDEFLFTPSPLVLHPDFRTLVSCNRARLNTKWQAASILPIEIVLSSGTRIYVEPAAGS